MKFHTQKQAIACAALSLLALLVARGDKKSPSAQIKSEPAMAGWAARELPSIAKKVGEYELVDMGKSLDLAGFMAYREQLMRSTAGASNVERSKFAEMAIIEVGSEPDAFKRDDQVKQAPQGEAR